MVPASRPENLSLRPQLRPWPEGRGGGARKRAPRRLLGGSPTAGALPPRAPTSGAVAALTTLRGLGRGHGAPRAGSSALTCLSVAPQRSGCCPAKRRRRAAGTAGTAPLHPGAPEPEHVRVGPPLPRSLQLAGPPGTGLSPAPGGRQRQTVGAGAGARERRSSGRDGLAEYWPRSCPAARRPYATSPAPPWKPTSDPWSVNGAAAQCADARPRVGAHSPRWSRRPPRPAPRGCAQPSVVTPAPTAGPARDRRRRQRQRHSGVVPGDSRSAMPGHTCAPLQGRPRRGSSPAGSQGAAHGPTLPVSRAPIQQPRGCPLRTAMSPNQHWMSAPDSRTPSLDPARPRPGRTREASPELARSPRTVLPRAPACRTLVPTAHQCGPDRCGPRRHHRQEGTTSPPPVPHPGLARQRKGSTSVVCVH